MWCVCVRVCVRAYVCMCVYLCVCTCACPSVFSFDKSIVNPSPHTETNNYYIQIDLFRLFLFTFSWKPVCQSRHDIYS